ncbi:MAG TPA: hypothetical protein VMU67_12560 [Steroidobacteraceae bacterium]|nr:hypothetical protein [Steroidobacteraceae bacterium]
MTNAVACAALALSLAIGARAADPVGELLACRGIPDEAARLRCFDRQAEVVARARGSPALAPKQTFGLAPGAIAEREVAAGTRRPDLSRISARIVRMVQATNGRYLFTLDNDQVWEQLLAEGDLLAKPGETVQISRGFLDSYWLKAPSGRGCKVTRVR